MLRDRSARSVAARISPLLTGAGPVGCAEAGCVGWRSARGALGSPLAMAKPETGVDLLPLRSARVFGSVPEEVWAVWVGPLTPRRGPGTEGAKPGCTELGRPASVMAGGSAGVAAA
jgi:hypothetical protein